MYRIDNSTAAAALPTPAAVGPNPNGFFTKGNPGSTPATIVDDDWANAVQEELCGVILGAGIALDKTNRAQLLAALKAFAQTHGQCQLTLQDTTHLLLSPFHGNRMLIPGTGPYAIPGAGLAVAVGSALVEGGTPAAGTFYYVYLSASAGLQLSATAPALDATTGIRIRTGDNTRVLVGACYLDTGPAFADTDGKRYVLSWFNRRGKRSRMSFTADRTTTSTTYVELNAEIRNSFISWAAEEVTFSVTGYVQNSNVGSSSSTAIGFDGTTAEPEQSAISSAGPAAVIGRKSGLTEAAVHYAALLAKVGAFTGTWVGSASVVAPILAEIVIQG